jgi:hypothetical protein
MTTHVVIFSLKAILAAWNRQGRRQESAERWELPSDPGVDREGCGKENLYGNTYKPPERGG